MPPVFVDTSIWYAAAADGDAHTQVARSLLRENAGTLVTSDVVLTELWNLVNARVNHHAADRIVSSITGGIARVECTTDDDLKAASDVLEVFPDQAFSLTDRTSWALMERLGIADALALDTDFRVYRYGPQRRKAFTVRP
ncbi:MAG: PIN domain-containing protein [Acidimicrobiia bacterium]|nr:PIN domain-containing protein [Acidimicrobiia bacterium]MYB45340.1 PIN domain-containing protein [Acidimicrobiia bacterium]